MSRIDQALERARQARQDTAFVGTTPDGTPAEALFTEAWDVSHEPRPPMAKSPPTSVVLPRRTRRSAPPAVPIAAPADAPTGAPISAPEIHAALTGKAVSTPGMPPLAIEQYRRLTSELYHEQLENHVKRLMVISAVAGEGKTLTSVNLALTLSHSHQRRVLLIDTDLRRPSLHAAFHVPGEPGLREAVQGPSDEALPIVRLDERLSLLPAGAPTTDPLQVLTSERMRTIVNQATHEYDWVILDTSPLALLPDAHVLSDMVDAAVLVISAGQTSHDLVLKAIQLLGRDKILGVVLNGVDSRDVSATQYYAPYYMHS
jgi:capsular exopolysaccharide synthesis family protein